MKKINWLMMVLLASVLALSACGGDKEQNAEDTDSDQQDSVTAPEAENEKDAVTESKTEDQLDLKMGDTGTFDTTLGTYEMTLDDAKLMGEELEGEKSTRDEFIVLDLTIKNTSDQPQLAEDLIVSMEVTNNLEHSGSSDHAEGFDTIKEFSGELKPGEEQSAQFLTIVDDADTYYFRKSVGNIAGGSSNQVIWTIQTKEIE